MLAPESQELSTIGHALGIQRGDRAVGGDSQANGALPLHVPGRPEGQAPPSGAMPVFDEGLLGRPPARLQRRQTIPDDKA